MAVDAENLWGACACVCVCRVVVQEEEEVWGPSKGRHLLMHSSSHLLKNIFFYNFFKKILKKFFIIFMRSEFPNARYRAALKLKF